MKSKYESLKNELASLVRRGERLFCAMADGVGELPEKTKKDLEKRGVKLPSFELEYDTWYSEALRVVKQVIPDRADDFVKQYKNEKRKEIDSVSYGISDYLLGLETTIGDRVVTRKSAAIPKMRAIHDIEIGREAI